VFGSIPFKFIAGGQSFYAHANLISRYSKPFEALMKSPMKEREQGYVVLEELTSDTFDCFLEWIYRGFYTAPRPKIVETTLPTLPDTSATEKTNEVEYVRSVDNFAVVDIERPIDEPILGFEWLWLFIWEEKG